MLSTIKSWISWPTKGIKNISDLGAYIKTHWMAWVFLILVGLLIYWIIRKTISWLFSLFSSS